jgi:hypothetical protein
MGKLSKIVYEVRNDKGSSSVTITTESITIRADKVIIK